MIVYKVTCIAPGESSGKCYIGKTQMSLERRKNQHFRSTASGSKYCFHNALRKYGKDGFIWEKIGECQTAEGLCALEKHYIGLYGSISPGGYNLTLGGGGTLGHGVSLDGRAKISAANKGNKNHFGHRHSPETRAKMSRAWKNRGPVTAETRAKMSASSSGEKNPFYGKRHSVETLAKISATSKGRMHTVEAKEKIAAAMRGRVLTMETRAKMSAAATARYAKTKED